MNDPFDALKQFLEAEKTHTMLTIVVHGTDNPVMVRTDVTVRSLIDIAKRKLDREEQEKRYGLYLYDDPLPLGRTIRDLQMNNLLHPSSKLVLRPFVQGTKIKDFLYLVDLATQTDVISFNRFPAIIGRKTPETPDVIDLGQMGERARTISRRHAEINEEGGDFVIKCLSERGLSVNDKPLAESESCKLTLPAEIQLGKAIKLRIERRSTPGK